MAMRYQLRPVMPSDDAVQLVIYASTREDELAVTDWPAEQRDRFVRMQHEAQQQHYRAHFPQSYCQLILIGEEAAGRLWIEERPEALHILDISLLPAHRGQGLGTACLRDLQDQASAHGRDLSIYVEIHNPAQRLYRRLGFVSQGVIQGVHQRMVWSAATPALAEALP
jgi:ribosomal protein S18 acetylase RimI-like enzyme